MKGDINMANDFDLVKQVYPRLPKDARFQISLPMSSRAAALRAIEWLHDARNEKSAHHVYKNGEHFVVFTKEHN